MNDRVLDGKAAVITGGSRGIGRAIVERLTRDGAQVVFGYARNDDAATEVEQAVAAAGGHAYGVRSDLGQPDGVATLFAGAARHLDGLDILVNNAAAPFAPTPLTELAEEHFDEVMAVNVKAVLHTLQHAAKHMRDDGRVVNLSTINTVLSSAGISAYAASKGAVEQLTLVAARELGGRGITVNTVSPGATDTELLRATNSAEGLEQVVRLTPLGRLGQTADVADVVAFLAGPDGRWLTGQNLRAGGGIA